MKLSNLTYSLHCSSFLGLAYYRILIIYLVKPKKGTTMVTIGMTQHLCEDPLVQGQARDVLGFGSLNPKGPKDPIIRYLGLG